MMFLSCIFEPLMRRGFFKVITSFCMFLTLLNGSTLTAFADIPVGIHCKPNANLHIPVPHLQPQPHYQIVMKKTKKKLRLFFLHGSRRLLIFTSVRLKRKVYEQSYMTQRVLCQALENTMRC